MYRTKFANGISRIYNLHNVNIVELNKTVITLKFNACKVNSNVTVDPDLYKEEIKFKDEKHASVEFEEIATSIDRIE